MVVWDETGCDGMVGWIAPEGLGRSETGRCGVRWFGKLYDCMMEWGE